MKKPDNFDKVIKRWKNGEIKAVEAMEELGVKKTVFYKMVKNLK